MGTELNAVGKAAIGLRLELNQGFLENHSAQSKERWHYWNFTATTFFIIGICSLEVTPTMSEHQHIRIFIYGCKRNEIISRLV